MLCVYVCFILSSICVLYTMKSFLIFFFLFSRLNKIANYSAFASHSNVFFRHVKFGTNLQLNRNTTKLVTTTPYPLGITGSFQCWTECNFLKYSIFSKFVFLGFVFVFENVSRDSANNANYHNNGSCWTTKMRVKNVFL